MLRRTVSERIVASLSDAPVVLINGARQTGKSTLAQWIAADPHPAKYLTLDDAFLLEAAMRDPNGFLTSHDGPIVIDEVQLAPGLFRAIKMQVDRQRRAGRFLLTGSAHVMLLPRLADALVGRMETHTLWPFSQGELEGAREGFVDALFENKLPSLRTDAISRRDLFERILRGGYPETAGQASAERRRDWFGAYVNTIIQRDIRNLSRIEGYMEFPRLLTLLAGQAASLLNMASLSRAADVAHTTLKRYLSLLQATFLAHLLPPWHTNVRKRLVKTPKVMFNDTGILSSLLDVDGTDRLLGGSPLAGPLLENFVGAELRKQISWSKTRPNLYYYRTDRGREVDYVLEDRRGRVVGIEVKAAATLGASDLKGLDDLAETAGERFHRGVIFYTGAEMLPCNPRVHALPIDALWRLAATV